MRRTFKSALCRPAGHPAQQLLSDKEKNASQSKASRMRKITHYIDEHYSEKLLLSDIARKEDLSLTYLSHFFKDYLGLPFQEYLAKSDAKKPASFYC